VMCKIIKEYLRYMGRRSV